MSILKKNQFFTNLCLLVTILIVTTLTNIFMTKTKSFASDKTGQLQIKMNNGYLRNSRPKINTRDMGWGQNYDYFFIHHWPDPVNVRNGNLFLYYQDLFIPSIGIPLRIERVYNSRSVYRTPFGFGWSLNYFSILTPETNEKLKVYESDGNVTIYNLASSTANYDTYRATGNNADIIRDKSAFNYIRFSRNCGKEYFNSAGRLAKLADRNGNSTSLHYDKVGNLTTVLDPANRAITFQYDTNGLITSIEDPLGRKLKYAYDERQNLIAAVDMGGHTTRYFYDAFHNLTLITYPDGSHTSFEYDIEKDLILAQEGPGTKKTTYRYYINSESLITIVTDSLGRKTKYVYEHLPLGLKFTKVDPLNKTVVRQYDAKGNLLKEVDKNGNEAFFDYDDSDRLIRITDPSGNITRISYCSDCPGNLLKAFTDPLGNRYVRNYDENCNLISITDPLGFTTRMKYDSKGNLIAITDAADYTTIMGYDEAGNIIEIGDTLGNVKGMKYDTLNRLIEAADAKGNSTRIKYDYKDRIIEILNPLKQRTAFVYDEVGRIKSILDPDGNQIGYVYDECGYLKEIIDPNGNSQHFQCDSEGNQIEISTFNGHVTKLYYDARDRLIRTEDPLGRNLEYAYDAMSNLITHSDASGKAVQFVFDSHHRIKQVIDSQGNKIKLGYDPCGALVSVIDEKNSEYRLLYDGLNRLIRTTNPDGHFVQYLYDAVGNVTKVIDENFNQRQFEYNPSGWLTKYIDQLGNAAHYTYDEEGNLRGKENRAGASTTYNYDSLNRLENIMAANELRAEFSYDSKGNLVSASNRNISYSFASDKVGNIKKKTAMMGSISLSLENEYNAENNRTALYSKGVKCRTYEYDKDERIKRIKNQFGEEFVISYNDLGLRKEILYPNGIAAVFEYCEFQKLCKLTIRHLKGGVLKTFCYAYDETGSLEEVTEDGNRTVRYTYDNLGRLKTIIEGNGRTCSYEYDPAGNRIGMKGFDGKAIQYNYNAANQLVRAGERAIEYDLNGNILSMSYGDRIASFAYDENKFLIEVKTDGKEIVKYQYGPFGERILKEKNDKRMFYVYDNEDILWVLDAKGNIVAEYTHGPGFDAPLSVRLANQSYYLHADRIGNVVLLTSPDGSEVCSYSYKPFGKFEQKGSHIENIHFFNGKLYDEKIGLYHFMNRYYDPSVGRFVQEDPLIISYGQSNLYAYPGNDPLNRVDPLGLEFRGLIGLFQDWVGNPMERLINNKAQENNVGSGSGGINEFFKDFNLLETIKRKDPAQLAKDCGAEGTPSNVDGTFGVKVGAGLRGEAKARFDHSSAQFKVKTKLSISSSAEAKACIELKEKGATGMDKLGGTNVGPVNYAFGVDSEGNWKGQLKTKVGPVTVKSNFGEDGKLDSGKVEIGPSVSVPVVRFKKDLAETETTLDIPGYTKIINELRKAPIGGNDCP